MALARKLMPLGHSELVDVFNVNLGLNSLPRTCSGESPLLEPIRI